MDEGGKVSERVRLEEGMDEGDNVGGKVRVEEGMGVKDVREGSETLAGVDVGIILSFVEEGDEIGLDFVIGDSG